MPRDTPTRPRYETELAEPVTAFLESQGYVVRARSTGATSWGFVTADGRRGTQTEFYGDAAGSGRRQTAVADAVYVALPRPGNPCAENAGAFSAISCGDWSWGAFCLVFGGKPKVQLCFIPPFDRKRDHRRRQVLLHETGGRSSDSAGRQQPPQTGHRLPRGMPPHRLRARNGRGKLSGRAARPGTGPKTRAILYDSVMAGSNAWTGASTRLQSAGREALAEYPDLAEHYRSEIRRLR